jgi:hypothetical protein
VAATRTLARKKRRPALTPRTLRVMSFVELPP